MATFFHVVNVTTDPPTVEVLRLFRESDKEIVFFDKGGVRQYGKKASLGRIHFCHTAAGAASMLRIYYFEKAQAAFAEAQRLTGKASVTDDDLIHEHLHPQPDEATVVPTDVQLNDSRGDNDGLPDGGG